MLGTRSGGRSSDLEVYHLRAPGCRDGWKELSGLCSGAGHGDFQVIGCGKGWRVWEPVSSVWLILCVKDVYILGNPQGGRVVHNQIGSLWSHRSVMSLKNEAWEAVP